MTDSNSMTDSDDELLRGIHPHVTNAHAKYQLMRKGLSGDSDDSALLAEAANMRMTSSSGGRRRKSRRHRKSRKSRRHKRSRKSRR